MAVLSKYKHLVGNTPRLVGFNTSNMIIDNKVYDEDFNLISDEIVETYGDNNELISTNCIGWSDVVKSGYYFGAKSPDKYINPTTDLSSENSPYGYFSVPDPFDPGISFTITSVRSIANKSVANACMTINRLDEKGHILATNTTNGDYAYADQPITGRIIAITEKYLFVLARGYYTADSLSYNGYYSYYGSYGENSAYPIVTMVFDRKTLAFVQQVLPIDGATTTGNLSEPMVPVLARTNDRIWLFNYITNAPVYLDLNNPSGNYKATPKKETTVINRPRTNYARYNKTYWDIPAINFTHAINGWQYYINWPASITNSQLRFQAFKIDTDKNSYETIDYSNMELTVSDKCVNAAKPVNHTDAIVSTQGCHGSNFYYLKKVNETDFVIIHGLAGTGGQYAEQIAPKFKTRYLYVHVDPDDPSKLTIENEQRFDFCYEGMPIIINNDKLAFVKPNKSIDVYRAKPDTHELELYWEITTPDIMQATWFNGYMWWTNNVTNELHYEMEDSTRTIKASLDNNIYQLERLDEPVEAIYSIEVLDSNNKRISANVQLNCSGPCEFSNGTTVKTITTSETDVTKETITITNAGKPRVTAKVIS